MRTRARWMWIAAIVLALIIAAGSYVVVGGLSAYRAAHDNDCVGHMANVLNALQQYYDVHGKLPDAVAKSPAGQLYSWRVALLPYLDLPELYNQYRFDEPWDGPHNKTLPMPEMYCCTRREVDGKTSFVVVRGEGTLFPVGREAVRLDQIADRLSETVVVLEGTTFTVPWMEPRDLPLADALDIIERARGSSRMRAHDLGVIVGCADWRSRCIDQNSSSHAASAVLTHSGGEELGPDDLR